ncbi:hypothetical protein [Bradyrhizobium arachidis]|uniref:hypothetical protein n=1 Tax=Bradyrhizobium arachidis TaxID=858423 RepID=UPI001AED2167|nr:hypothetical protein [Bradyrhizobium arachidis]
MNDRSSIEWALELGSEHDEERLAIRHLITSAAVKMKEPFRSAWSWLLESWSAMPQTGPDTRYGLIARARQKSIDGDVLRQVVDLVRPWPRIKRREDWSLYGGPALPKVPRKLGDLVFISMTSGDLISLHDVGLEDITNVALADELADRLEAALLDGLHVAQRLGWTEGIDLTNSEVRRVYHVSGFAGSEEDSGRDPDAYRHGFAPVTKLLYEAIEVLARIDVENAKLRIVRWNASKWALFKRLWAALARNPNLASAECLSKFLSDLTDKEFWKVAEYPEFAELRARRFSDLDEAAKLALETRIQRLPPKTLWTNKPVPKELERYRHIRAGIEFKRILAAPAQVSDISQAWIENIAAKYELPNVTTVDFDFEGTSSTRWMQEEEETFEALDSASAVRNLENAFSKERWGNAGAAQVYLESHLSEILELFSASPELSANSPGVWGQVLRLSRPANQTSAPTEEATIQAELERGRAFVILTLLNSVPERHLETMIDGLSGWIADWAGSLKGNPMFSALWLRAWPPAVDVTNKRGTPSKDDEVTDLLGERDSDLGERLATAALNTPAGVMMTAFLRMCPNLNEVPHPFASGALRDMRDSAARATGATRLQVLHRFLSSLEYMRRADEAWTDQNLLDPLNNADGTEIEVWDAISRNPVLRYDTMLRIGERMAEVAHSSALPIETRARLGERVVYRVLLDKNDGREPSIPERVVQQMLRLGTDRLRAAGGRIAGVFIEADDRRSSREDRLRKVVVPFFETIWPLERTLASPSLSKELARLPAKSGTAFAEAVDAIARFLTPFDCWSLHDYGLYERDADGKNLREIIGEAASALLTLLDMTIGSEERAVHPLDLDRALVAIRGANPKLVRDTRYARLSALERH